MREGALYYPYIHVRDVEWLKATLLLFDEVARMVPDPHKTPRDSSEIEPFLVPQGGHAPLLRPADLWSKRVIDEQAALAKRLRDSAADRAFVERHGQRATEQEKPPGALGFQIHQEKLQDELKDALRRTGLAWEPGNPEPYDLHRDYVELHPRVGQAVMATLAVACASGEGLAIVAEGDEGPLHRCLIERKQEDVYDAWLGAQDRASDPAQADDAELFQVLVTVACDTSRLDAQALAELGGDRKPLRLLLAELDKRAKNIPAMDQGERRKRRLEAEIADVLEKWRQDRANMSKFWRKFFGHGVIDSLAQFARPIAGPLTGGAATGVGAAAAATGAGASMTTAALTAATAGGAGAGLAIGLVAHAAKTVRDIKQEEADSPYRYLTILEKNHVTFMSDVHLHHRWRAPPR